MTGDPSGEVDRLPVDIAVADDDESSGDPGMCRRQPGRLDVGDEPENRPDSVGGTAEAQQDAVAEKLDDTPTGVAHRVVGDGLESSGHVGRDLVAVLHRQRREPGQVDERDRGRRLRPRLQPTRADQGPLDRSMIRRLSVCSS